MYWIWKEPIVIEWKSSPLATAKVLYCFGTDPKQITAICCRQKETPSALISGAIRGALFSRSGR